MSIIDAVKDVLEKNGGPIDSDDTTDGRDYVMVRRLDFDALAKAFLDYKDRQHQLEPLFD